MSLRSVNVLILEDSSEDMELYLRSLKRSLQYDFHVTQAGTIAEAGSLASERDFDCYVVDYKLPDGDGIEFIKYLRDHKTPSALSAIVMITGQGTEEIAVEALKLGAHDYITKKSISDGYFVRPIINALERARLTEIVAHYQAELIRSNSELSQFAHTASHDLKAPIRRITSYCDILKEDAAQRLNEEDMRILDRMILNARRMQSLVDGLLNYSLMDYEKEEAAQVDVAQVIDELKEELEPQIDETAATLVIKPLPVIKALPLRIRQLFSNLLNNALKYRDPERKLMIEVGCCMTDLGSAFYVKDTGMGIPEEKLDYIFKDFKRLHGQDEIEGNGLGLAICTKIAAQHNGKIWATSEAGKGTTFFVTIPQD